MFRRLIFSFALFWPALAGAQSVQQLPPVTQGHLAYWVAPGVIGDAGPATAGKITNVGIFSNGGLPFCETASTVPLLSFNPLSSPYNQVCISTSASSAAVLSLQNYNGAAAQGLNVLVNGFTALSISSTGGATLPEGISVGSIAPIAANTLVANATNATASPTASTLSGYLDSAIGSTQGDMVVRTGLGWQSLGPGALGACLTSQGAAANLIWGSCSGTGSSGTVTSVATGTGLTGGTITTSGTLSLAAASSDTIKSNITGGSAAPTDNSLTAILDAVIGTTQGSVLERGASVWGSIPPNTTANTIFTSGGSAANPSYQGLSAIIDAVIGSTRGSLLERGASGWSLLAPGTSGNVLTSNGSSSDPSYQVVASSAPWPSTTNNVVTTSGTVTIPTGAARAIITVCGGGGGSGSGGGVAGAGGGGGAACAEQFFSGFTGGNTLLVTIGGGGAASTGSGNAGTGGTTTVASGTQTIATLSANGGHPGSDFNSGTSGPGTGAASQPTTSGASLTIPGGSGDDGVGTSNGGRGGSSLYGMGGGQTIAGCKSASNYGAGSGGSFSGNGCAGSPGVVIIQWYS